MRGGDLSNDIAPGIGMRFERVIKTEEGKLNRAAKGFLEQTGQLDINVHVVTTGERRRCLAFLVKWNVPYYEVHEAESLLEIPLICVENQLLTYYDIDVNLLQNVRARGSERVDAVHWDRWEVA